MLFNALKEAFICIYFMFFISFTGKTEIPWQLRNLDQQRITRNTKKILLLF